MQQWKPDIAGAEGPKYLAIAAALTRDIDAGVLQAGARLPTQRVLAKALGVDLTTVTRAFGEAHRLGLVEGDGRRGSFVRAPRSDAPAIIYSEPADVGMNAPPEAPGGQLAAAFRRSAERLLGGDHGPAPFQYQPSGGLTLAREAGVKVLSRRGIPCSDDTVIVAAGGQHALHAVVSAALQPGDAVALGSYAYPGMLALARRYGLKLVPVAADEHGLDPDALNAACHVSPIRAVYVVPTNDNPTTTTMDVERRHAIARVARAHDLALIEDDAYGLLREQPLEPLAAIAPELTWHISSVSKILSPGLRVAWLAAPDIGKAWRLAADLYETAVMAPPLNAAIVADWVASDRFAALTGAVREEALARQGIATEELRPGSFRAQPEGYHLWVPLDPGMSSGDIAGALRSRGLSVVPSDSFAVQRGDAAPALRVSIGGMISREDLRRGLGFLAALIAPDAVHKVTLV
ncbi:PLP-dependent aminotransferase family protein [Sphingomonas sp. TX0543]|uniref:aminotransferase-like domain-containing protein n=1 Tax=unclassified Sphingomonas TaxID=196159 RepID=UPI0010F7C145|nr:PLP-dependent aminotransferase family protein [Sphingomonas sp. 3P27F8]